MERFLILGCQRSGTTLMRLLLESHSDVACVDEILSYLVLLGITGHTTQKPLLGFKIPIWTEQMLYPQLQGNELSFTAPELAQADNFYHGEKLIFLVRDPLDVVASMMTLTMRGGQKWMEVVGAPMMQEKRKDSTFALRFSKELSQVDSAAERIVALGALYWTFKNAALLDYLAAGLPVLPVSYEQLVADPETQLRRVVEFLGVEWQPDVLRHNELPHTQIRNGKAIGDTDPTRPIDSQSVGQWQRLLTNPQAATVKSIADPLVHAINGTFQT